MEIRELQSVLTAFIERSYEEAAEKSGFAVSTVAKHVQRVEEELGVCLFNRAVKGRPLSCTVHGETIVGLISRLLGEYDKIMIYSGSITTEKKNRLVILSLPVEGTRGEREVNTEFCLKHPNVVLSPKHAITADMIKMINDGSADGGFLILFSYQDSPDAIRDFCMRDDIILIPLDSQRHPLMTCARSHPFAARNEISISDLCNETILMNISFTYPENSAAFKTPYIYKELEKNNLQHNIKWIDMHIGGGLISMITCGKSVCVSTRMFDSMLSNAVTMPIIDVFQPTVLAFASSKHNLSPSLKKFREICVKHSEKHYEQIPEMQIEKYL